MLLLTHTEPVNTRALSPQTVGRAVDRQQHSACSCFLQGIWHNGTHRWPCVELRCNLLTSSYCVPGLFCCSWSLKAVWRAGLVPAFLSRRPMIHLHTVAITQGVVFQELSRCGRIIRPKDSVWFLHRTAINQMSARIN